jgi:hypothetical protein
MVILGEGGGGARGILFLLICVNFYFITPNSQELKALLY